MGIGVFGTGLAYVLWNEGISQIGADKAGIFVNIVPLSAAVGTLLLGKEIIYPYHWVSSCVIILGLFLASRKTT